MPARILIGGSLSWRYPWRIGHVCSASLTEFHTVVYLRSAFFAKSHVRSPPGADFTSPEKQFLSECTHLHTGSHINIEFSSLSIIFNIRAGILHEHGFVESACNGASFRFSVSGE